MQKIQEDNSIKRDQNYFIFLMISQFACYCDLPLDTVKSISNNKGFSQIMKLVLRLVINSSLLIYANLQVVEMSREYYNFFTYR